MESIFRAMIIYFFLMLVMRISGKRTLAEITIFDFVLVLIIGDSSQQAITGNDYSIINALLVILTLIFLDLTLSFLKSKSTKLERIVDGKPYVLVIDGKPRKRFLDNLRVDIEDILEAARKWHGVERIEEIKYAILEKDGDITIVPKKKSN